MQFCSQCGAQVNGRFCRRCGYPNDFELDGNNPRETVPTSKPSAQPQARMPSNSTVRSRPKAVETAVKFLYITLWIGVLWGSGIWRSE